MRTTNYVVYYTCRHVFNVQYVLLNDVPGYPMKDELLELAKNAVKSAIGRSDTITAITSKDGAWVHVGNGNFEYYGD